MNRKGQALVEFVIILPVFLALLFLSIDFGKILYTKIRLENISSDVISLYKKNYSKNKINEYIEDNGLSASYSIKNEGDYITLNMESKVNIMTPGLNIALDNPYPVVIKRKVLNE